MEKIENEKIYTIILAVFTTICITIITVFFLFCIGLSEVEAKSYSWTQPTMMSFHTTKGNFTSLKSCTGVNECFYSENGDYVANFASARYQFSRSLTDASTYAEQNTYSLSVRFRIVTLDEISKSNTNVTMYYYPDNSNNYSLATCDGTQELTISKNADYDYYVTYKCNEFTINRDISHMGLMIGGYPNSIYFVQMAQNLQLIGPGEASNDDIINNQNQNTQDIINNQNQNTDKIIGSIEGEGLKDTTPIDPNKKEELEEIEEGLLDEDISTQLSDIDISIDTNTNEFIWNLVTRIVNTHSMIFGFVLTMLSLGVLKLVLNR